MRPLKKSQKTTKASFRVFDEGEEGWLNALSLNKDAKDGSNVISTLSGVQLGASTIRTVSAMSDNMTLA